MVRRKKRLWMAAVADVVLVVAAVTVMTVVLFDRRPATSAPPTREAPDGWQRELLTGIDLGAPTGKVEIIEFMDLECPFCAQWAARLDTVLAEHPGQLRVVLHHFPLDNHPSAVPAAIALECAERQLRAREMLKAILDRGRELSTVDWPQIAGVAGVVDLEAFRACSALPSDSFPRIAYGKDLGMRSGVRGTPTIWVDGDVITPSVIQLRDLVRDATR